MLIPNVALIVKQKILDRKNENSYLKLISNCELCAQIAMLERLEKAALRNYDFSYLPGMYHTEVMICSFFGKAICKSIA